jgi:hypothetical protein
MKTIFPVCENAAETQKLDMGRDFEICENNFYNTVRTERIKQLVILKNFRIRDDKIICNMCAPNLNTSSR